MPKVFLLSTALLFAFATLVSPVAAQMLEEELKHISAAELAKLAKAEGDAVRGAVVFFQPHMACSKCHAIGKLNQKGLGPDLTALGKEASDESLVDSVLLPSKVIRKGFESITVVTDDGKSLTALLVEQTPEKLTVRDILRGGELTTLEAKSIEEIKANPLSIMPAGQVNQLHSRQQFLDLIRYLMEIRDGGEARAVQLQPAAALLTYVVPEYEKHLDHAGLIGSWNGETLKRGEAIYQRVCANCHGTKDKLGSLPTSLRFAEGKFKNGSDPLAMYRTLTYGFGLMVPQSWMVPSQKYDVIHYIREAYLKPHNPSQFVPVDPKLLAGLPPGDTRGPEPSKIVPWSSMNYGPSLAHTFEVPGPKHNLAYKGIAVRLDPGAGGISRGTNWTIFDTDTLRTAAGWQGNGEPSENFIDWQGIQFNGAHGIHPRIVGKTAFANSTGPGWADPASGAFEDVRRIQGRDGKRYGPLPRDWGQYRGLYHHGQQVVFSYSVGNAEILESPSLLTGEGPQSTPLFQRTLNIGPRTRDLILQVAEHPAQNAQLVAASPANKSAVLFTSADPPTETEDQRPFSFNGNSYLEVAQGQAFDLTTKDFTIAARIKTKQEGTLWSLSQPGPKWTPDGQTFFIRGGRLCFDIGWVGVVTAKSKVNDGNWHQVAATYQHAEHRLRLYVDGKLDGEGVLQAKSAPANRVARIGFTSPDFPRPQSFFQGEISEIRFYQQRLTTGLEKFAPPADQTLVARWLMKDVAEGKAKDATGHENVAVVRRGKGTVRAAAAGSLVAGFAPHNVAATWEANQGRLQLKIKAGNEPLKFTVWLASETQTVSVAETKQWAANLATLPMPQASQDLAALTRGGPPRWPQKLETQPMLGEAQGAFATDVLTAPEANPWLAQTRFTGLDFFPDGRIAVCSWDGDVWLVENVPPTAPATAPALRWQRIASGLYQPLGLKIVNGKIHLTCRDQLAVLHDLNDDGEIDFYQCLNNDHQVTEHFHEFAMGLQTDDEGNFYYAKSGCHGIKAVVPHHGTLLKVSQDGERTEILANGFRAANGVCLNPDGSFVVTDQEGFWNPKNRINWVTVNPAGPPNFYGNMLGYHDVTDPADGAMVPPLCWITNAFDRSPAELLWVESDRWGPLNGSLLNLSYGNGKVFVVPHEKVNGTMQGGMVALPIPSFPTGVMRGRFHPVDGQLYVCGMFAWAGNATYPGGLYRLRATGQPIHMPTELHARRSGLTLKFTEPLDPQSIDAKNFQIKTWSLKRTANYGSKHFDEKPLEVRRATLSADSKTLTLDIANLSPTWCMEIQYTLRSAQGTPIHGSIHNTIHHLAD